jgi:hypothetical protein
MTNPAMTMTQITPSLDSLAIQINQEYALSQEHLKATLSHGRAFLIHRRNTGELLIAAKAQVKHGEWLPWLQSNCPQISDRTARHWMQIARDWESIPAEVEGIRDALVALSPAKTETVAILPRQPWEEDPKAFKAWGETGADIWLAHVYLLMALGEPVAEIAIRTGKTAAQCLRALDPEFPDRWQKPLSTDEERQGFALYPLVAPEFIPYYSQCLKHGAYRTMIGGYDRAIIPCGDDPQLARLLTMQRNTITAKANAIAPEYPFFDVARVSENKPFMTALGLMMLADIAYAIGITERSEVDDHPMPFFYVHEAMEKLEPSP